MTLDDAQALHEAKVELRAGAGTANALALWFSCELASGIPLSVAPDDPPTHWGATTVPLLEPVSLSVGTEVGARVRTVPAIDTGTWTSWSVPLATALAGARRAGRLARARGLRWQAAA